MNGYEFRIAGSDGYLAYCTCGEIGPMLRMAPTIDLGRVELWRDSVAEWRSDHYLSAATVRGVTYHGVCRTMVGQ